MFARLAKASLGSALYAALVFLGAGRVEWIRGWVYLAVFVTTSVIGSAVISRANPELLQERAKGIRKDTQTFDRKFYLMFMPLALTYPLIAGMDAGRFLWAPLPWWTVYPGSLFFLFGSALSTWAMMVNTHAETTVRIQGNRGHIVVAKGPYAFVRHPIYLGTVMGLPGTALMVGSGFALLPMCLITVLFVWRTAREDRALLLELAGYQQYSERTRYRLLPRVW